jgi:sterol desaturase/sphingolipid hydroxylase (fatty acid hydroxylase superfamily)
LATLGVIFGSLLLVAGWEFLRPRRRREFPAVRRRVGNFGFWIVNLLIGCLFVAPDPEVRALVAATLGVVAPSWPLAYVPLSLLAGFLLLDLLQYVVHRLEHAVPILWRIHALHHSDPDVDVTTAVRHHPAEILFTSATYWLAVLVLDIPAAGALSYGLALFGTAAVQHGNIRLPERLERLLQPVLVTVDTHRIHHSVAFEEANSNYGAVFSVWDRLFGSYASLTRVQHDGIAFGLRELPRQECLKLSAMMLTPWRVARASCALQSRARSAAGGR